MAFRHRLIENITSSMDGLTPNGRILGEYIIAQPRKAVFMTTRELASRQGNALKAHQARLEQSYWENDVLFNMKDLDGRTPE